MSYWTLFVPKPWAASSFRRGDLLGFSNVVTEISEHWAPGISSRQKDLRWLTLLCKALASINNTEGKPYHLMSKFERGILFSASNRGEGTGGRHLPYYKKAAGHTWPDKYVYCGPWGIYKSLLVTCKLVEMDNPWCLTENGKRLAALIDIDLTLDGRTKAIAQLDSTQWQKWWPRHDSNSALKRAERKIIRPHLFGDDRISQFRIDTVKNLNCKSFLTFCNRQPLGKQAYLFHQLSSSCLDVLKKSFKQTNPNQTVCIKHVDIPKFLQNKIDINQWGNCQELVNNIAGTPEIISTILTWHIEHSAKPIFAITNNGYTRIVTKDVKIRGAYSYRLLNLWSFSKQLLQDHSRGDIPSWFNNIIEVSTDNNGENDDTME